MPFYTKLCPILLLICYQLLLADASTVCYNPDQVVPENPYYVCNTTSGEHSACCAPGDPCTANGYCFGSAGYIYRGGCTDITWQSPNCCPACRDSATNSFSNVYPCPLNNGSCAFSWCCGAQEGSQEAKEGCCTGTLFAPIFGTLTTPEAETNAPDPNLSTLATSSSHIATSPSSVASPTSTSLLEPAVTPTPTQVKPSSRPAQPSQKSVAVGTGVGVPVGVLLLSGLVLLFLRERRRRVHAQNMANGAYRVAEERETNGVRSHELYGQSLPQELEHAQKGPEELSSREIHEASGNP